MDFTFGICLDCKNERSSLKWCKVCENNSFRENFNNWTSGNLNIDNFIKHTQLNATRS
ncbi:10159_t:CDS:1, partial [Funneliformis caledonium]